MTCEKCVEQLSLYMDEMLTEKEEKEIVAHLASCGTCQEEYNQLKAVIELLHDGQEEIDLPEGFHESLMSRIQQESKVVPLKTKKPLWRYGASLVATLFIGVVTMTQLSTLTSQNKSDNVMPQVAESAPYMAMENARTEESVPEEKLKEAATESGLSEEKQQEIGRAYTANMNLDEAPVQVVEVWEIEVVDQADFLTQLKAYLEEVELIYIENNLELVISEGSQHEGVKAFIESYEGLVKLNILNVGETDLKLIFKA